MSSYKHGRPSQKISHKPLAVIMVLIAAALGFIYFNFIAGASQTTINNPNKPLVTDISTKQKDTVVNEQNFTFTLPGSWKLGSRNWDNRYTSWQWNLNDPKSAGRWFRVYMDRLPADQAVNYLLPVKAAGSGLELGQISDNCVNFTQGAKTEAERPSYVPLNQASLPSRWQSVDFLCDNANYNHQVVGISTLEAINSVTLTGSTSGTHKYYLLYNDSNFTPDFNIFSTILMSFKAK